VTTNRDLLVRVLDHPAFLAGNTDTGFLDRHGLSRLAAPLAGHEAVRRHALAAALASQAANRAAARVQPTIPSGYRNNPSSLQQTAYDVGGETVTVGYRFDTRGENLTAVEVDGAPYEVDTADADPEGATFYADGVGRRYRIDRHGPTIFVDGPDGSSVLHEQLRFPVATDQLAAGSALAPMPGGVVRVEVAEGDTVESGQLLVVLEAMKMEHAVHAGAAGTVTAVEVTEGDQVETGRILVVVEPEGPTGPGDNPDVEDGDAPAGGPNSDGRNSDGPTGGTAGEGTADGALDGPPESTADGPPGAAPDGPTSAGPAGRG